MHQKILASIKSVVVFKPPQLGPIFLASKVASRLLFKALNLSWFYKVLGNTFMLNLFNNSVDICFKYTEVNHLSLMVGFFCWGHCQTLN
jgi:hypothetical protein